MRFPAALLLLFATAALAAGGFAASQFPMGLAGLFLGLVWALLAAADPKARFLTPLLVLFVSLCALVALAGGAPVLLTAAVSLALLGWDAALVSRAVSPFPPRDRRRFAAKRVLESLALGAGSVGLCALAVTAPLRLGFSATLALGLLALLLVGVGVRGILGPPARRRRSAADRHPLMPRPPRRA